MEKKRIPPKMIWSALWSGKVIIDVIYNFWRKALSKSLVVFHAFVLFICFRWNIVLWKISFEFRTYSGSIVLLVIPVILLNERMKFYSKAENFRSLFFLLFLSPIQRFNDGSLTRCGHKSAQKKQWKIGQ